MSQGGAGEVPILCATLLYAKKTMLIKFDLFIVTGFYHPFPITNTTSLSFLCCAGVHFFRGGINENLQQKNQRGSFRPPCGCALGTSDFDAQMSDIKI
jgi:hypothetical protein